MRATRRAILGGALVGAAVPALAGDTRAAGATTTPAGDSLPVRVDPDHATAVRATSPLTIPTGYAGNDVVEPKVLHFPDGCPVGMDGARYVLLACPYPGSDASYENPSLWVSDDGDNWRVPAGITNPIMPSLVGGGGYGYNSDGDLLLVDNVWHLFWNQFGPDPDNWCVRYASSTDGLTWSAPVDAIATPITSVRTTCPVVLYDAVRSLWVMYAVDIVPNVRQLIRYTAAAPAGPWTRNDPAYTWPRNDRSPWHLNVCQMPGGQHVLLIDDTGNGGSGAGDLYLATSDDAGETVTVARQPLLRATGTNTWDRGLYRSAMTPVWTGDGLALDTWVGGTNSGTWRLGRTRATFTRARDGAAITSRLRTGAGLYYTSPLGPSTAVLANGSMRCSPWYADRPVTLDRIGVEVTDLGDAGAVVRLGIYADDGSGCPGALILDAGPVPAGTTGWHETTINLSLPPGVYWLAGVTQGVTVTAPRVRIGQGQTYSALPAVGSTSPLVISQNGGVGYQAGGVTGNLPQLFTASPPAGLSSVAHRVCVRVT